MYATDEDKTPGRKLLFAILIGLALAIPIFVVWMLVYDRQDQSQQASASITEGWGGPQAMSGPVLVIPFSQTTTETSTVSGKTVTRTQEVVRELTLEPEAVELVTTINPQLRKRSI